MPIARHSPFDRKRSSSSKGWIAGVFTLALVTFAIVPACERMSERQGDAPADGVRADPLPSWGESDAKSRIVDFVGRVTKEGGPEFVAPEERIATFDNDGTLWVEQPIYVQAAYLVDRVQTFAPDHPEWSKDPPFQGILAGDLKAVAAAGQDGIVKVLAATSSGMTTSEFEGQVNDWLGVARDRRFDRPHTDLVYQPMLELLGYLRANGFKTYIVSGGGSDFIRPWAPEVYGIPPEQVVGSRSKVTYEVRDGVPVLVRVPEVDLIDDGKGKPVGIHQLIGRRPIAAFGNSDGDFEMLEWTTSAPGPRLGLIVHHTDAVREWSYDRDSNVGKLSRALDAAPERGWVVVDMKRDWKVVFPFERPSQPR